MLVKDVMKKNVKVAHADMKIIDATRLMSKHHVGSLIILNDRGDIIGILTETDILNDAVAKLPPDHGRRSRVVVQGRAVEAGIFGSVTLDPKNGARVVIVPNLLARGGHRISEIAYLVGYQNYRDFYRNFVKYEKASPREVQRQLRRTRPPDAPGLRAASSTRT